MPPPAPLGAGIQKGLMPHTPLGYSTKQENIAVTGVADMVIRSLLDKRMLTYVRGG